MERKENSLNRIRMMKRLKKGL